MRPSLDLNTINGCRGFVGTQPASDIAKQLRKDYEICQTRQKNTLPTLLVYCLPSPSSNAARAISQSFFSDTTTPPSILKMRWIGILNSIKGHLENLELDVEPAILNSRKQLTPTDDEFAAALKVLSYLRVSPFNINDSTPFKSVIETVAAQLTMGPDLRQAVRKETIDVRWPHSKHRINRCYICHYKIMFPHKLYPGLCDPCGRFNIAENELSYPQNLDLRGKTAVVTGGRINLGYCTALRLLRCGAQVVVTSRYPLDTAYRYLQEPDKDEWVHRLKLVGADFRDTRDVFDVTKAVAAALYSWGKGKLDILINNAAQTWTDKLDAERACIEREEHLRISDSGGLLIETGYHARLRGGQRQKLLRDKEEIEEESTALTTGINALTVTHPDAPLTTKSTWTQNLSDIPYPDVATTYTVNALAPLILTRELLPLLSPSPIPQPPPPVGSHLPPPKPIAYIINVSSREGEPEAIPRHRRAGYHVHTNMAKAALNMLTETEAAFMWKQGRVAVNSVDPGYLSADKQWLKMWSVDEDAPCPITWEDGVGRVLYPITVGENTQTTGSAAVWGRFFKHYVSVQATR